MGSIPSKRNVSTLTNVDFSRIICEGKRIRGKYMTLFYVYGTRRRTGIAVSRKIQKAVERNRAKRRFREILRREGDGLDICTEQVWLLEPNLINAPLHRIRSDFNEILGKII